MVLGYLEHQCLRAKLFCAGVRAPVLPHQVSGKLSLSWNLSEVSVRAMRKVERRKLSHNLPA